MSTEQCRKNGSRGSFQATSADKCFFGLMFVCLETRVSFFNELSACLLIHVNTLCGDPQVGHYLGGYQIVYHCSGEQCFWHNLCFVLIQFSDSTKGILIQKCRDVYALRSC